MYCEDAEFRGLLPQFKIMILSIKHETLRSTLWLLFTNPANHCLLTAKHPLPRPTLQYTGLTLPSLHHISDCSHITRRFRDEISTELSKNGFFEGQKQASLAGWFQSRKHYLYCIVQAGHWGFIEYRPQTKKPRISTKYRPHSTLSTKYRPQKFLEKRTFTIFTFKSWDIHILGKWGLSWNMRDKWGLFQLRTFRKALYMDHTALCRPYIQTIIETSIKVYVLNLKML